MVQNKVEKIKLNSVDSTNNEAKRLVSIGRENTFLVVADEQTGGRGRQGKSFYSPKGTGIYMSFVYCPKGELKDSVGVTAAAAVCVCRAIERLTDKKPKIKWVNDIYLENKKICGILTEAVLNPQGNYSIIVGIGINLSTKSFPPDTQNAGSLGVNVDKDELIDVLCGELLNILSSDFGDFISDYRERSIVIGKEVKLIQNGQTAFAKAVGIDDGAGLVVEIEGGERKTLRSGEISLVMC